MRRIDVIIMNNNDASGVGKTVFSRAPHMLPAVSLTVLPRTPRAVSDQPAPQNRAQRVPLREVNADA